MLGAPLVALLGLALSAPASRSNARLLPGPSLNEFSLARGTGLFAGRAGSAIPRQDTLEIHVFLVRFAKETSDNGATTGDGTFGSEKLEYALEPAKARAERPREHFRRLLDFQQRYWTDASQGRLVLEFRIFPTGDSLFYTLDRTMGWYSPAQAAEGEKKASFDSTRLSRYLEMVSDAARKAASDPAGPFATSPAPTSTRHRAYMLVHAGANGFTDGGKGGSSNANSKSDMNDFYVEDSTFQYLRLRGRVVDTSHFRDSLGVVLGKPGADTLKRLLIAPETGSQDGLNWGIHGLISNQIGRHVGLPDTWDWVRGYSAMGRFCGMDFGGYLLPGSGFLPVRPSAWLRLYMGWATPVLATPSGNRRVRLPAVAPGSDSVLVVPLDDGEYLLVENRSRSEASGKIRLRMAPDLDGAEQTVEVSPDSLEKLFLDSLDGRPNPRRLKGYILDATPDAGLPGSGLVVWKVSEWLLRSALVYGGPNVWRGDEMRDRYRGISLVEADGVPSVGVVFTSVTGGSAFDYGTGADLLPHLVKHADRRDTISAIGPLAYTSTRNLADGRSLVTLRAAWPATATLEGGRGVPSNDSIYNAGGARPFDLSLDWGPYRDTLANFPLRTTPAWGDAALLPGPVAGSLWVLDTNGRTQLVLPDGTPAFASRDSLKIPQTWDSVRTTIPNAGASDTLRLPIQRVGTPLGRPLGSALLADTILAVRTASGLHLRTLVGGLPLRGSDTAIVRDLLFPGVFVAGPIVVGERVWVASADSLLGFDASGAHISRPLPFTAHDLAEFHQSGRVAVAAVGPSARLAIADLATDSVRTLGAGLDAVAGETFRLAVSDFDRDGSDDAFALGSRGSALLAGRQGVFPGWPRRFDRGQESAPETSAPALADLDGDGRPEAIFAGNDRVHAIDRGGLQLPRWPVRIGRTEPVGLATASRRWPAGFIGSAPVVADLDGDSRPEVLIGLPDARIAALSASGVFHEGVLEGRTAGTGLSPVYAQSRWPLAAGGRVGDTLRPPVLHLALVPARGTESVRLHALGSLSTLDGFRLNGATTSWNLPGADARRSARLDASLLAAASQGSKAIDGFHIFPSPVRAKSGTFRWSLGRPASSVTLTVFDQTGFAILTRSGVCSSQGSCDLPLSDLRWGTGVYAARLQVDWSEGGSAESWTRFGVIR